jgi:hypothetical protein
LRRDRQRKNRTKQNNKTVENIFKHRIEMRNAKQKAIPGQAHIVPGG